MLSPSTRRIGVVLIAVSGAACGADRSIAPSGAVPQQYVSLFADSAGVAVDSVPANAVARRGASAVLVPADTVRLVTDTKLSRGRRTAYTSTNSAVASVNSSGLVQARVEGTALVIASDGSRADTLSVQVEPGPAKIDLASSAVAVSVGSSYQLGATVVSSTGVTLTGRTLRFSSQNASVVSVSDVGLLTARASGQTSVSVTDGKIVADVQVAVQTTSTATGFTMSPGTSSVPTGGSLQFTTATTWADGVSRVSTVTYSATGGAISVGGLFTAGSVAGTFRVIALCICGLADTSVVTVTPAATLVGITIAPKTVTLAPGATQAFSTTARWSNGSTAVPLISYLATGGSVTSAGVYTAPTTVGTYKVIVAETAGPLRDTAVVTVAASGGSPTTPPPTSPPPPGALFTDSFESGAFGFTQNGVRWSGTPWTEVTSMIAHSGTKSVRFRQGDSQSWAELRFDGLPNLKEVFVQYYLYMPSGNEQPFVGPRVKVLGGKNDKFFRIWGGGDAGYDAANGTKVGASLFGDGSGVDGMMNIEYMYSLPGGQWPIGEGWWGEPNTRTPFVTDANRGKWLQMRIRTKVASAANNDGVVQIWVNGQILLNRTNLQNANISGSGPNAYTTGYLLGWANNGYAPGQNMFVDDFTISGTGFPQ